MGCRPPRPRAATGHPADRRIARTGRLDAQKTRPAPNRTCPVRRPGYPSGCDDHESPASRGPGRRCRSGNPDPQAALTPPCADASLVLRLGEFACDSCGAFGPAPDAFCLSGARELQVIHQSAALILSCSFVFILLLSFGSHGRQDSRSVAGRPGRNSDAARGDHGHGGRRGPRARRPPGPVPRQPEDDRGTHRGGVEARRPRPPPRGGEAARCPRVADGWTDSVLRGGPEASRGRPPPGRGRAGTRTLDCTPAPTGLPLHRPQALRLCLADQEGPGDGALARGNRRMQLPHGGIRHEANRQGRRENGRTGVSSSGRSRTRSGRACSWSRRRPVRRCASRIVRDSRARRRAWPSA